MRFNDAILGAFLVIFAAAEIAYSTTFPSLFGQKYGPDLFPRLIGIGLIVCGLMLIVKGIKQRTQALKAQTVGEHGAWLAMGSWAGQARTRNNVALVLLCLIGYIVFSSWLGFIPLSLLILCVLMVRLGARLPLALGCAVLATVVIQLLFAKLLLVPLPPGVLLPFLH